MVDATPVTRLMRKDGPSSSLDVLSEREQSVLALMAEGRSNDGIAQRYRTVHIRAGQQVLSAANPLPQDLRDALALIS